MHANPSLRWLAPAVCTILLAQAAGAQTADPQPVPIEQLAINREEAAAHQLHVLAVEEAAPGNPASPLQLELQQILAGEADALHQLDAQLQGVDAARARELERRIAQVKQDTEINLLRAQQRYALQDGKQEQADAIEAAIEQILHPAPVLVKSQRPAPQVTPR